MPAALARSACPGRPPRRPEDPARGGAAARALGAAARGGPGGGARGRRRLRRAAQYSGAQIGRARRRASRALPPATNPLREPNPPPRRATGQPRRTERWGRVLLGGTKWVRWRQATDRVAGLLPAPPSRSELLLCHLAFLGHFEHSLDAKNRLSIPARFRAAFAGGTAMGKDPDGCVTVWPLETHEQMVERAPSPASTRWARSTAS